MPIRSTHPFALLLAFAVLLIATACGGDGGDGNADGGGGDDAAGASDGGSDSSGGGGDSQSSGGGGMTVGAPTQSADPGHGWVEVDGRRIEYEASGSINYNCLVTADEVRVNFQSPGGHDFVINAVLQSGAWLGSLTVHPGDEDVQYGGSIPADVATLGVGDSTVSYEGTLDKIVGVDVMNAETMDATIAVNCASPGGDPTAVIDGTSYVFPLSGAQSVTCAVAEDQIEVRINRLAIDNLQLEIEATGPEWAGAIVVYAGEERFRSTIPADGEGLTLNGGSLSYEGTFVDTADGSFEGTVEVTCS